jgi:ankyrin repeat protein
LTAEDGKPGNLDEQLWEACLENDWAQAAFLLEAGAGTERRGEGNGTTAIMRAALWGSLETVTLLFNRGANIHARCNDGWTAMMCASSNNFADIVSYLADKGTDIHVRSDDGEERC